MRILTILYKNYSSHLRDVESPWETVKNFVHFFHNFFKGTEQKELKILPKSNFSFNFSQGF